MYAGSAGYVWTSVALSAFVPHLFFDAANSYLHAYRRVRAYSLRCLRAFAESVKRFGYGVPGK